MQSSSKRSNSHLMTPPAPTHGERKVRHFSLSASRNFYQPLFLLAQWTIRVPASSANIGPGFDVLGLALSRHLTLNVSLTPCSESDSKVLLNYTGEGASEAPLDPYKNLITRVALYVLLSHHLSFPDAIVKVDIDNQVPFGRGLGSSAAAVVAGVLLGDALGDLKLPQERVKDYALMVERHPDNVTAALCGGFTGSFLRMLDPSELAPSSIPLAEVLPAYPANAGPPKPGQAEPPQPPKNVGRHVRYGFSKDIGVVVVVPKFEVETAKARGALPDSYARADVVSYLSFTFFFSHSHRTTLTTLENRCSTFNDSLFLLLLSRPLLSIPPSFGRPCETRCTNLKEKA